MKVIAKISKWLLVAMLASSIGLQWTLLQSVAWVGMLITYSCENSLHDAVAKTFDGKHPCPLCKLVRAGQNSGKKTDAQQTVKTPDMIASRGTVFHFDPLPSAQLPAVVSFSQRSESPPLPPPRQLPG